MRISDWSSDVCSSDLLSCGHLYRPTALRRLLRQTGQLPGLWRGAVAASPGLLPQACSRRSCWRRPQSAALDCPAPRLISALWSATQPCRDEGPVCLSWCHSPHSRTLTLRRRECGSLLAELPIGPTGDALCTSTHRPCGAVVRSARVRCLRGCYFLRP